MNIIVNKKQVLEEYLFIVIGTTMLAIGINIFFEPWGIVTGGVSGLAIIIKKVLEDLYSLEVPIWLTNFILNIPIFLIGFKALGTKILKRTLFSTIYLSIALYYTSFIPTDAITQAEPLVASIFGGVISGIGMALVFTSFSTTGGTDLAARILHRYMPQIPMSKALFMLDSLIVMAGVFVFGITKAMYAVIAVYITTKAIDSILEGFNFSKAAFIVSENSETIANRILSDLDRGVTGLNGRGMYTLKNREILMCVVSRKQVMHLKNIVKSVDSNAFLMIFDVRETFGEGFQVETETNKH